LTVALCGAAYAHPEHFSGLRTVILALDARRALWLEFTARGIEVLVLPASALDGAKDLGEYWQHFHAMPTQLMARVIGPHMQDTIGYPMEGDTPHGGNAADDRGHLHMVTIDELRHQPAAYRPAMPGHSSELSADLKADAETLAIALGNDPDTLAAFWGDLRRRESLLTREECIAATYALWLAIAF